MIQLDEILYNAVRADAALMEAVGGRVVSTCFEVSPDDKDNTPLPCIIINDNGRQAQPETKDSGWLLSEWKVQADIEVDAESPKDVDRIIEMCNRAVAAYVATLDYADTPQLDSIQTAGKAWDWMKPCYHGRLIYQCIVYKKYTDNGQEE